MGALGLRFVGRFGGLVHRLPMRERRLHMTMVTAIAAIATAALGCQKDAADPAAATVTAAASPDGDVVLSKSAKLAALGMTTTIYEKPQTSAKKLGYLRVGATVARSDKSYGSDSCPGGWYAIAPRGFVCSGKYATLDLETPLVRAASVRPDTGRPLPYAYGFVRSVSPLYTRMPSREEQIKNEYKLRNHFRWFDNHRDVEQRIERGANDFARELIPDAAEVPAQEGLADVKFFGGKTDEDPPPFWIEHGNRSIPNVTGFAQQPQSFFLNRIKRHTGVAFVGAFDSGPELDHRKFAITVDLRLVPIDKVKPETGSTWHGVELTGVMKLPVSFARPCALRDKRAPMMPCRHVFRLDGERMRLGDAVPPRAFLRLTGTRKVVDDVPFWETTAGYWMREKDLALAVTPHTWPGAAERGEKWIDISLDNQTLVAWDGKKPVFTTLISAGQDGVGDPKTTKSTVRGVFRVKSKHITTTMDSNERSSESGGKSPDRFAGESARADDEHDSSFELRDVPYVQYFHDGYAIHAAYWHDRFGLPRSHGCINLSPIDAMRLFRFTDPVPAGWHGVALEPGKGTIIIIRR
jgi:lipoprotein-anchoring transpeptidase ErfK/SrfK